MPAKVKKSTPSWAKRSGPEPVTIIGASIVLLLIVVMVVWFVISGNSKSKTVDQVSDKLSSLAIHTEGSGDVPTIDIIEDPMCPSCKQFEQTFGRDIAERVDDGTLKVRYHFVNFLDRASASGDYSTRVIAAAIHIANKSPDSWLKWHNAIYAVQPKEGGDRDLTSNEIADIAISTGTPREVAQELRRISQLIPPAESSANDTTDFITDQFGSLATPMVIFEGKEVEPGAGWLDRIK